MKRRRRQHGLSMSKRRRRRVRRHRRFSVPGEVREVGYLVDGEWPVWECLPRPGPLAQRPQSQALRGTLPGRGQGCPPFHLLQARGCASGAGPALGARPSRAQRTGGGIGVSGVRGTEAGAQRAPRRSLPRSPALLRGGARGRFSDYFGVLIQRGSLGPPSS